MGHTQDDTAFPTRVSHMTMEPSKLDAKIMLASWGFHRTAVALAPNACSCRVDSNQVLRKHSPNALSYAFRATRNLERYWVICHNSTCRCTCRKVSSRVCLAAHR